MQKREALVQGRIQSKAQRTLFEFWIMLLTDGVGGRLTLEVIYNVGICVNYL